LAHRSDKKRIFVKADKSQRGSIEIWSLHHIISYFGGTFMPGLQSWRVVGSRPARFLAGGVVGLVDWSWNIIISYHVQEVYSKVVNHWRMKRNRIICPEVAVNEQFLPEKIEISRKFAWKNRNFVEPDALPPRFQNRL